MGSKRLPGKVLMNLAGKPMIMHIVERARQCKNVSEVVVATSTEHSDNDLSNYCINNDIRCIRGSLDNVLKRFIKVLKFYPNASFSIEGHTDSIGSYEINKRLSDARANAVKTYLVKNGIDSTRLFAIGYGERKPLATNMYKAGRKQNRRVEINLVK